MIAAIANTMSWPTGIEKLIAVDARDEQRAENEAERDARGSRRSAR